MRAMDITFLGGATTVTGSTFLITTDRARVLVDCGMFQGSPNESIRNRVPFGFDPADLDAVLLTHAHLDHCGRLPLLVKEGYRGTILATAPTSGGSVRLWDVADPEHPRPLGEPLRLGTRFTSELAFTPDGRTLVTGADDQSVTLWNVTDPVRPVPRGAPLTGPTNLVRSATVSPDGRSLVVASAVPKLPPPTTRISPGEEARVFFARGDELISKIPERKIGFDNIKSIGDRSGTSGHPCVPARHAGGSF